MQPTRDQKSCNSADIGLKLGGCRGTRAELTRSLQPSRWSLQAFTALNDSAERVWDWWSAKLFRPQRCEPVYVIVICYPIRAQYKTAVHLRCKYIRHVKSAQCPTCSREATFAVFSVIRLCLLNQLGNDFLACLLITACHINFRPCQI